MNILKRHAINVVRGVDKSIFPKSFWNQYLVFRIEKSGIWSGIWFYRNGDEIMYIFPWKRKSKAKYISLLATTNGEFGDAYFISLKELDNYWEKVSNAFEQLQEEHTAI